MRDNQSRPALSLLLVAVLHEQEEEAVGPHVNTAY
jgi:hypothetical protein